MTKKTLSIGGATYDLFVRLPQETSSESCHSTDVFALPLGAKIRVKQLIEACGGGANNTSVGLARLGCTASFEGVLGTDQWADALLSNFAKEGVNAQYALQVEQEVTSFSIILSGNSGERVILYEPGTNAHLHDANFDRDALSNMDWVYFNHIQEDSCVIQDDIVAALTQQNSPQLTWNPGGCQIDLGLESANNRELLAHTDLLLLNKQEALTFTKTDDINAALQVFVNAGVRYTCITDGSRGTIATDGTTRYHCPVVKDTEIVDTTGAGDAFGTAATWALLQGFDLPIALKAGSINGANVVGAIGAQTALLIDTEMNQRLEETNLVVEATPL